MSGDGGAISSRLGTFRVKEWEVRGINLKWKQEPKYVEISCEVECSRYRGEGIVGSEVPAWFTYGPDVVFAGHWIANQSDDCGNGNYLLSIKSSGEIVGSGVDEETTT